MSERTPNKKLEDHKSCDQNNPYILDIVTPIQFKQTLLIPIKVNLEKLFGKNQIKFQISIKNNKLIFESPKILVNLDFQDNIPPEEAINVKYHSETL